MQLLDENCPRNQVIVKESFFSVDGKIFACEAKKNCFLPLFETNIKAIKNLLGNGKDMTKINVCIFFLFQVSTYEYVSTFPFCENISVI